jgi:ribonuclease D
MQYAADDVRFLPALRGEVGARLAAAGHTEWAAAECGALADPALYEFNALSQCRRIRGTRDLTARQLATLAALLQWRERCARAEGIPARSLVKDEILKAMARRPARSPEDLTRAASLSRNVIRAEGENIVRAIDQARAMDEKDLPPVRPQVESGIERHRIDCAWAFVQAWCFGQSVHPNLISSRQELADLLVADSLAEAVGQSRLGRGWRKELLGGRLEGFLAGTAALHLQWNDDGELRSALDTEGGR